MKTTELSEIRSMLWESAEMAYVRFQLFLWSGVYGVTLLICCSGDNWKLTFPLLAGCMSIVYLPILVFWLVRQVRIFRMAGEYVICRTVLTQPHHAALGRGLFSFMGVIETEEGRFAVETHAIFRSSGVGLLMEDYLGQTVTLAWNRKTDMVVVIG